MNAYFWLFSLCAVLMTPVTLHTQIRFKDGFRYKIRMQIAGYPVLKRKREEESQEQKIHAGQMAEKLFSVDRPLVWSLLREGHLGGLMRAFRLEVIWLYARIAFADAAMNAVAYAAVRTALQSALICTKHSVPLRGRMEMDFDGRGSELLVRCILSSRLGIMMAAALRLLAAILRTRARHLMTEGETHAAASH